MHAYYILYSGKFSREKTFTDFEVQEPSAKVFFAEFGGRTALTYGWFQATCESFLREILTSYGSVKFSPSKVYCYMV